ncbi:MAG: lamin tail domain-containing protein [Patescibacteria group bacterium]|jgi:hypothetical protein
MYQRHIALYFATKGEAEKSAQKRLALFSICCFCALYFILAQSAHAANNSVVINEAYYNVDPMYGLDPNDEWIELYNPSDNPIDLINWKISDNTTTRAIITQTALLLPKSFALVSRSKTTWSKWGIKADEVNSALVPIELGSNIGNGLGNNGDKLVLSDSNGMIIDQVSWGNNKTVFDIKSVAKGHSIERKHLGSDSDNGEDFIDRILPTPGTQYVPPTFPDGISITEILPEPANGSDNEFIEIFNESTSSVDLSNWIIQDRSNTSFSFPVGTALNSGAYHALYKTQTKLSLNDNGDGIRLLDPNGQQKSSVSYEKSTKGKSYSLVDDSWQWSDTPTPGNKNILAQVQTTYQASNNESDLPLSIANAKLLDDDQNIKVSGSITAPPGTLSDQSSYIQDWSGGIQLYSYYRDFPELKYGDFITVDGILSTAFNERRLKIQSIQKFENRPTLKPHEVAPDRIGEETEGEYITLSGKITARAGDSYLINGIPVLFREGTRASGFRPKSDDIILVSGIVSQYKDKFRLLPFREDDVKILDSETPSPGNETLPSTGTSALIPLQLSFIIFAAWNTLATTKKKLTHWRIK